jgi:hypothetical protein
MVPGRIGVDLCFVLQPAKGLGVDDAIPVSLKRGSDRSFHLRLFPAPAALCQSGERGKDLLLEFFLSGADHAPVYFSFSPRVSFSAAWAAANRATGKRKGEQET